MGEIENVMVEISNVNNLSCDYVFALFCIYLYKFSSKEFFKEAIIVLIFFRETLNQKHQSNISLDEIAQPLYCQKQGSENVPEMANSFILEYFFKCI